MSSKYQKPFTIPEGFPELLKGFTREILRTQPDNIYEYAAAYFADLQGKAGASKAGPDGALADTVPMAATQPSPPRIGLDNIQQTAGSLSLAVLNAAELEPILLRLFLEADVDSSGFLDRYEFAAVLRAGGLSLSDRQVREVLSEADENEDGVIQYKEFLPVMVDILQAIKAREAAEEAVDRVQEEARDQAAGLLLRGLPPGELEQIMLKVFTKADVDKSGQLSRQEFKGCLRAAELGLTRRDINLMLSQVDINKDGLVSYSEFIPICFQILVERFKEQLVTRDVLSSAEGVQGLLLEAFQAADPEGSGVLPSQVIKTVLQDLSYQVLGLTAVQLVSLISQAPGEAAGEVAYLKFVPHAAAMISSIYDADSIKQRLQAIEQVSAAGGIRALSQLDIDTLRSVLGAAFEAADTEASGQLSEQAVIDVLQSLGTVGEVQLTDAHRRALFAAIDADASGAVDWPELVNFVCDAIEHMEREVFIVQMASTA